jgi:hypothetical protein
MLVIMMDIGVHGKVFHMVGKSMGIGLDLLSMKNLNTHQITCSNFK